jgi:hypothetical protein
MVALTFFSDLPAVFAEGKPESGAPRNQFAASGILFSRTKVKAALNFAPDRVEGGRA